MFVFVRPAVANCSLACVVVGVFVGVKPSPSLLTSCSLYFRLFEASLSFIRLKMAANEGKRFDFLLLLAPLLALLSLLPLSLFTGAFASNSDTAAVVAVVAVDVALTSALSVSLLHDGRC